MSEWTSPAQPVRCVVELDKPLAVHRERGVLAQGDENANAIVAEVYSTAGKPYDLSGCTVQLIFVRPDNNALPAINAEINGNTATATLTGSAYAMSGMYSLRMQLRKNGTERTIVWIIGEVKGTDVDGIADPEHVISIGDIMASAKEAQTAASNANAAAQRANSGAERVEQLQIDASGLAGDSNKLGDKNPEYYLPAVQLLDNPDFAVAQAGYGGLHGAEKYAADRWIINRAVCAKVTNGLSLAWNGTESSNGYIVQKVSHAFETGATYTIAAKIDGTISAFSFQYSDGIDKVGYHSDGKRFCRFLAENKSVTFYVTSTTPVIFQWVALYKGTYTAATLPPFVPPDHTLELMKCQRVLMPVPTDAILTGFSGSSGAINLFVPCPYMSPTATPTVINGDGIDIVVVGNNIFQTCTDWTVNKYADGGVRITTPTTLSTFKTAVSGYVNTTNTRMFISCEP